MLALSGCHDSTLAAILTSLGALKLETWPQFTSYVTLELFRESEEYVEEKWVVNDGALPAASAQRLKIDDRHHQASQQDRVLDQKPADRESPPKIGRRRVDSLYPSERTQLDGYYVRVLYNGKPLTVPGCNTSNKHLDGDQTFCTLEAFKGIVDKFTPLNWKKDCRRNLDKPAIPSRPEPAGY
ncbi:hypothetical protein ONS95_007720 [Cadophora gregata]|uniref:uncharacterized protein n=1 Tax=Cadophora gregata TaxID=51156 RepID=UPI0026DA9B39|nr:uncharacterized protein ONS95_007720 [Cadophora gregata]KAK0118842.1 hypothetical protein ONS96_011924 [Cadophora gregata f. sp. sojae]KAK0126101.1 hypothetical protein ONS95_007720 [Cadophora gregata]